jgi:hypothetical protein
MMDDFAPPLIMGFVFGVMVGFFCGMEFDHMYCDTACGAFKVETCRNGIAVCAQPDGGLKAVKVK